MRLQKLVGVFFVRFIAGDWKKGKDPHPQDKNQHPDFTKDLIFLSLVFLPQKESGKRSLAKK